MSSDLVLTLPIHRKCNQACGFCYFRSADADAIPTSAVREKLMDARHQGAEIVRFTGGEPLLDKRLLEFVSVAQNLGYPHIEVETNATVASLKIGQKTYIDKLRDAGLTRAWVAIMSRIPSVNDQWTRDPGGADRTWAAVDHMAKTDIAVGLNIAVFHGNIGHLADLIDEVARRVGSRFDAIRFFVIPDSGTSYNAIEKGLWTGCARARHHRVDYRFESSHAPPPCVFSSKFLLVHSPLYASYYHRTQTAGTGRIRFDACNQCALASRCQGGVQAVIEANPELAPLRPPDESAVSALLGQLGGVLRHTASQLSVVKLQHSTGRKLEKPNVRVVWACNQRCRFCWVDFDWAAPAKDKVFEQLDHLWRDGHQMVSLTGGEPTLVPWLPEIIAHARSLGFRSIQLQTNGTLLQTPAVVSRLVKAGLTEALVSLHSHQPAVSDVITQAPGTWHRTIQGIDHLIDAGVSTSISHVLTLRNLAETEQFVDWVADRWGSRVGIVWSVAAPITSASSRYNDSIPPLDVAGVALRAGLERCVDRNMDYTGQNDTCGVPRCVLGQDVRFVVDLSPEIANESGFIRPNICNSCRHHDVCRGVRNAYFRLHGDTGLIPHP
ncbi:MAG: radical SAM protein [Myxococcales bacterium]|nr:radical SAM protein [Myxococcales bacterium]